jgi:hypothetical protein
MGCVRLNYSEFPDSCREPTRSRGQSPLRRRRAYPARVSHADHPLALRGGDNISRHSCRASHRGIPFNRAIRPPGDRHGPSGNSTGLPDGFHQVETFVTSRKFLEPAMKILDLLANVLILPSLCLFLFGQWVSNQDRQGHTSYIMLLGIGCMAAVALMKAVAYAPEWIRKGKSP